MQSIVIVQAIEVEKWPGANSIPGSQVRKRMALGKALDYAVVEKTYVEQKARVSRQDTNKFDGTVSDVQVNTSSRKDQYETIEMIKNTL